MEILQKKIQLLLSLFKLKKHFEAESLNRQLLKDYPKNVFLHNLLGLILISQKKFDQAIKSYNDSIQQWDNHAPFYDNLGTAYKLTNNYDKAELCYKKSIEINPKAPEPQNNLGNLYLTINKHHEAIECFKKSLKINENFLSAHYNLASTYKSIGMFSKAKQHYQSTIKLNTNFYTAHRSLSELIKYTKKDKHLEVLKEIYNKKNNIDENKTELVFALAKAHEDIKNYNKAFQYFSEANKLRRKNINFSFKKEKNIFLDIKRVFNKPLFEKFQNSGSLDTSPIFILGMPRSGSTLIEQILSSHPEVYGGDELNFLPNLISRHISDAEGNLNIKKVSDFNKDKTNIIGRDYIKLIKGLSNNANKITDKLPVNFKWIGLIKIILPKAKIVHSIRNSKDNCLSIFKNYFSNPQLNFAYDLNEISFFYKSYRDLMKHWEKILPNFVINVEYEKLVKNPRTEIHKLLSSCDLKWDDKCLKYYDNNRLIKTASDTQARKKIYKSSVNSWKKYSNYMKKFFNDISN